MNENEKLSVDINTAEIEELTQIPGIGPELASRIVAKRPYQTLDDLQRVSGISTVFIERIAAYTELPSAPVESVEEEPGEEIMDMAESPEIGAEEETLKAPLPEEQVETLEIPVEVEEEALEELPEPEVEGESVEAVVPVAEEEIPEEAAPLLEEDKAPEEEKVAVQEGVPAVEGEPSPAPALTRAQAVWITLGGMFFTLVLSLLLSLGILAGVNNGGLQFASPAQVNELSARAESLRTAIDTNAQDIESLRKRVDNLDALSGRVTAVEQDVERIGSSMEAVTAQVGELDQQVSELAGQIDTLQEQTDRFSNFLSGLMELMNSLFTSEEGGK